MKSQKELMELIDREFRRKLSGWNTTHGEPFSPTHGIPCFPYFQPWIKPEFIGLATVYHLGTCVDTVFTCILRFTDDRLQEMPPHPPGECPWCEYKWFKMEKC